MKSYFENVVMPDGNFRIDCFTSASFGHVIELNPHWHPEVEILYVLDGAARQQVNDRFFTINPGDIVMIGMNQLHSTYSFQGNGCEILVIMADVSSLLYDADLPENQDYSFDSRVLFKNPVASGSNAGKQLLECILGIRDELALKAITYKYAVKSLLYRILCLLARNDLLEANIYEDNSSSKFTRHMLENTFKLITDAFSEKISLKQAAEASNLSTSHFCKLFRKTTGMTFNEYLTFYRVNRAEKLLNSDRTITEISYECGFGSLSTFYRSFKKYKLYTPLSVKHPGKNRP